MLHDVDVPTLAGLAGLARGLDAPVTLGLNLQSGDPANALALARAARRRLGARLDGLEVGNEPDLYTVARTIGPVTVRRLRKRARYTPADYARDAGRYVDALAAGLPRGAARAKASIPRNGGRATTVPPRRANGA